MTVPIEMLKDMVDILYRKGAICDFGINESLLQVTVELACTRYPGKAVRAIKQWVWWDLDVSAKARRQYEASGIQPAIMFSTYLVWDSGDRWSEGWNVKTTALVSFEENCFFITRNTVYILVGNGYRKTVDPQLAASVYF